MLSKVLYINCLINIIFPVKPELQMSEVGKHDAALQHILFDKCLTTA